MVGTPQRSRGCPRVRGCHPSFTIAATALLAAMPAMAGAPPLATRPLWTVPAQGIVNAPPLIAGNRVLVGGFDHRFYAIDRTTGRLLWKYRAQGAIGQVPAARSDSLVIFSASDSMLYALRLRDGALAWRTPLHAPFADAFAPLVAERLVMIGTSDGTVRAHDLATGRERWRAPVEGRPFGALGLRGGVLFAATFEYTPADHVAEGYVYALDAHTGSMRWRTVLPSVEQLKGGGAAGVALDDSTVYVGSNNGALYALRQRDGSVRWRVSLGSVVLTRSGVGNGVVYAGCLGGRFVALSADSGQSRWSFQAAGSIDLGPPSIEGNLVAFSASDSHVYVLNRKGVMLLKLPGGFSPVLRDSVLYFGGFDDSRRTHSIEAIQLITVRSSGPSRARAPSRRAGKGGDHASP